MPARLDGCMERKLSVDPGRRFFFAEIQNGMHCMYRTSTRPETLMRGASIPHFVQLLPCPHNAYRYRDPYVPDQNSMDV